MDSIKVITYNCQSFRKNLDFIKLLVNKCDILLLQETILPSHALDIAMSLNDNDNMVDYFFVPSSRDENNFYGRSKGGLAFIWKKSMTPTITIKPFDDRLCGLSIMSGNKSILLLNVYMPCDYRNNESLLEYRSILAKLSNILTDESGKHDDIICAGDWNADPGKGRFFTELKILIEDLFLIVADIIELPSTSHTYTSANENCSTSWIDHVVTKSTTSIFDCEILYGTTFYDHIPLKFTFEFPDYEINASNNSCDSYLEDDQFILWNKLSELDLLIYKDVLDSLCEDHINRVFDCKEKFCNNLEHRNELDSVYDFVVGAIKTSSTHITANRSGNNGKKVAGWNSHCKNLHHIARQQYIAWVRKGKPRDCLLFTEMKNSRARFRNALSFCKRNELKIRKQNLTNKFMSKNKCSYWKEIKKLNHTNIRKNESECIDGFTNLDDIVRNFDEKYKRILDDPNSKQLPEGYDATIATLPLKEQINSCKIFQHAIDSGIESLKIGLGWDSVHSNHLKFSGRNFRLLLGRLFSCFIRHCYLPRQLLKGEIRPIIKNNLGDKTSSGNYRPIMNSSSLLKLFEYSSIMPYLKRFLKINPRQFAYRAGVGCTTAATILNEVTRKYVNEGSSVHSLMVDFSKAYDRTNLHILSQKLVNSDLPPLITGTVISMYSNSYIGVRYNGTRSATDWKTGNGLRQGGVTSGLLFTFYMNEILDTICQLSIGCKIYHYFVNILCYADDLVLLCPSANGLQFLIDKFTILAHKLCLNVNIDKTFLIVFSKTKNIINEFPVSMNGTLIKRVASCKYLGMIFNENLVLKDDIERCCRSFLSQFNAMFYKFSFVDREQLVFLFKSYCRSFYGCELWYSNLNSKNLFNNIAASYHNALKRSLNLTKWHNNHLAAQMSGALLFKHLLAERIVSYYVSLIKSKNPCTNDLRHFIAHDSCIAKCTRDYFREQYLIFDLINQPLCAIKSRIDFVQRNEESSEYIPNFVNM